MNEHFVMCARAVRRGEFMSEPGPTQFLLVPENELPAPGHKRPQADWFKRLREAAVWNPQDPRRAKDPSRGVERGDILVFVHGYNNSQEVVMQRHRRLIQDLTGVGFKGAVVSFDWPSADQALNYVEDRHDAKQAAMQLVTDGVRVLAQEQTPNCMINTHLLGHSTGAYVIREAFDDADDASLGNDSWMASQIVFIGGDISANSLSQGDSSSESLYRHCVRLTNYSNSYDSVLKLSNAKRMGIAPRVGRIGLPNNVPAKAVNVDCTRYFAQLASNDKNNDLYRRDQQVEIGTFEHSWHIGNLGFARDLFETLKGDLNREVFPTRQLKDGNVLELIVS